MQRDDWLRLLGERWSICDNIGQYLDELLVSEYFWNREGPHSVQHGMMDEDERAAYDALPEVFTIYRGCGKSNKWGLSWTTSKECAEKFPMYGRYRPEGKAILVTAEVKKSEVIAVKLDRNEFEIITYRPKHLSTKRIKELAAA